MSRPGKRSILWIVIPFLAVLTFLLISVSFILDPNNYRGIIQESLTTALGREVTIGRAKLSWWGGLGIAFEDIRVRDRSLAFDLLQSKRLILRLKLLPLVRKEIRWKRIIFEQPVIKLSRDKKGQISLFDGSLTGKALKASQQRMAQSLATLFGASLTLQDGKISFTDEALGDAPFVTTLRSFHLQISEIAHQKPFTFRLHGQVGDSKTDGFFSLSGTLQNILEDLDLSKGKLEAEIVMRGISLSHYWPYLKGLLPMKAVSGMLDLNGRYRGDLSGRFKGSLKMELTDALFDYPRVFSYVLTPRWLHINVDMDCNKKEINFPQVSVEMPEIWVKAKGRIYGIGTEGMGMDAEAWSGSFDLSDGKRLVPYRIITPHLSDSLFRATGSGKVQILSVKLSGKMPEIDHCDEPVNAHVLSVEMRLDGDQIQLPWEVPSLDELKGILRFKDGDLRLEDVEGRVFQSSFGRTNGFFRQLLQRPKLDVQCEGELRLEDLPKLMKIEGLFGQSPEALSQISQLSGGADYRLSLAGELAPPWRFQYQGAYLLSKARFVHRQLPYPIVIGEGKIGLSNEALQWLGTKVDFGNSSLSMDGVWKWNETSGPLEISAKGKVDLRNLSSFFQSPILPEEVRSKAKGIEDLFGTAELSFSGRTIRDHFSYEGQFIPKETFFLPKGLSSPLSVREGTFSFSNVGIRCSGIRFQSGKSFLILNGFIRGERLNLSTSGSIDLNYFRSLLQSTLFPSQLRSRLEGVQEVTGEAEFNLKWLGRTEALETLLREGEVRWKGVSLKVREIPLPLSESEGMLLISSDQFQFVGMKGNLGNASVAVSGTLSRQPGPAPSQEALRELTFQAYSPRLDLDELFPKKEEKASSSYEAWKQWLSQWSVNGKIEVDQGIYRGFPFEKLKVEMKTTAGRLVFQPQLKGAGGDLWGEGWVQPAEKGIGFQIRPRISNMEGKAFLRTLLGKGKDEKILLSGSIRIDQTEVGGEGIDAQEMAESLHGSLRLTMENGVIEHASTLAKIFSLLNVSQLFKGRLPDLKTRGLPYRRITANVLVRNGVLSTEDLLVDSDAMRITLVGKIDLPRRQIDARIGVHPLITVDAIMSNIPIAGYILTGKDKAFVSYVYEVKGDLNDPKIEAVPMKALGEGFLGIMQRLLLTPFRPFMKATPQEYGTEKQGDAGK